MTINTSDPVTINIPRVNVTRNGRVDPLEVAGNIFLVILFVILSTAVITYIIHQVKWDGTPPPKTITKVVHEDGLTYAQNQYMDQCEKDKKDINPDDSDQPLVEGVPNVVVNPWTCIFPH